MSRAPSPVIATGVPGAAVGWPGLAVAGILTLAALGAYWNSFNVPLLFDDSWAITDNPSIRHLGRIGDVLSPPTATTVARPMLNLTFALNYAWGGLSVRGYHAVNLLIHVCAGLTLLGLVRRTLLLPSLRPRYGEAALPLAALAALLWTLHPLQTEAVTYISQRAESLMGLFYLLTLYGFIRAGESFALEPSGLAQQPGVRWWSGLSASVGMARGASALGTTRSTSANPIGGAQQASPTTGGLVCPWLLAFVAWPQSRSW
jgi:hypothetical protein